MVFSTLFKSFCFVRVWVIDDEDKKKGIATLLVLESMTPRLI